MVKCRPAVQETQVQSLGWEDPLEKDAQLCQAVQSETRSALNQ